YNKGAPIGWWKFDECQGLTAFDSSGLGNTGAISIGASGTQNSLGTCQVGTSAAWTNGSSGKINSSLNFDGVDDYIDCGDNSSLNLTTAFTLSTWLKTNNADSGYIVGRFQATDAGYMMRWSNTQLTLYYGNTENVSSSSFPSSTDWTHAVITFDNGIVKFYRNGIPIGSTSGITINSADSIHNTISNRWGGSGTGHHFSGQIDDVRIYNYALTPEQVKVLYNGGAVSFN
ncbi:MAG: LamG domain-containing protein, partial [Candidatus Shapirobacteria bacterium]